MAHRVVGEPVNFRGLVYAPVNEQGVVFLFGKLLEDLNMHVESIGQDFPDCIALRRAGKGYEKVRVEFEFASLEFLRHKHDHSKCDLIVCWQHNWPDCPLEVIELKQVVANIGRVPASKDAAPDTTSPFHERMKRIGTRPEVQSLFDDTDRQLLALDERVSRQISLPQGEWAGYYSPERPFISLRAAQKHILVIVYTGGTAMPGVQQYEGKEYGYLRVASAGDIPGALTVAREALARIRADLAKPGADTWGAIKAEEADTTEEVAAEEGAAPTPPAAP